MERVRPAQNVDRRVCGLGGRLRGRGGGWGRARESGRGNGRMRAVPARHAADGPWAPRMWTGIVGSERAKRSEIKARKKCVGGFAARGNFCFGYGDGGDRRGARESRGGRG